MLYNLFKYENDLCFDIWDLGLSNIQIKKIKKILKLLRKSKKDIIIHYDLFNYSNYPSFFNIKKNSGEYAWKSTIISTAYYRYKKTLLWLDAGCYIKGSLLNVYNEIYKRKIYTIGAGSTIKYFTHVDTLRFLNASLQIQKKLMCAGGVVGLYFPSSNVSSLLSKWVICSLNIECIAPYLSNRSNHRQDQSVFSILLYQHNFGCYNTRPLNFTTHFDRPYKKYNNTDYSSILEKLN